MATTAESSVQSDATTRTWSGAVVGGLAAGVIMGLFMHFGMDAMAMVGALYGQPTVVAGWTAHLLHSVVFALVFAAVLTRTPLSEYATSLARIEVLGAAYGIVLWIVAASFVMPIWLDAVGAASLAVPTFDATSFVAHLAYGIVLGAVYAITVSRLSARSADTTGA